MARRWDSGPSAHHRRIESEIGMKLLGPLGATLISLATTMATGQQAAAPPADPGWPRMFEKDGNQVVVFQPQIDEWANSQMLRARIAVAVTRAGTQQKAYGIAKVEAATRADFQSRSVALDQPKITSL